MLSALKPILASTRFTRESRYSQLEMILKLLIEPSTSVNEHPANILNELETILHDIKSEENLFQSKLSVLLSKSLQKQWRPIISDHRRSLQSIGRFTHLLTHLLTHLHTYLFRIQIGNIRPG